MLQITHTWYIKKKRKEVNVRKRVTKDENWLHVASVGEYASHDL